MHDPVFPDPLNGLQPYLAFRPLWWLRLLVPNFVDPSHVVSELWGVVVFAFAFEWDIAYNNLHSTTVHAVMYVCYRLLNPLMDLAEILHSGAPHGGEGFRKKVFRFDYRAAHRVDPKCVPGASSLPQAYIYSEA